MKITLNKTSEQRELVAAMGSRDPAISRPAQEAFAAAAGPIVRKVLMQAPTASQFYRDWEYNEDDSPSLPLDLFYDQDVNMIPIWSQSIAGGLATSQIESSGELKFQPYRLDTAVSFGKKYARRSVLDVVAKALARMSNELLVKQDRQAWSPILRALAEAQTKGLKHIIRSATAGVFQLDDLNKLMTRVKRINVSYASGQPSNFSYQGLTDLILSTEMMEQVRGFCYQPMNTRAGSLTTSGATSVPLPDSIRTEIFNGGGQQSIFGVSLHSFPEFGINGPKYNVLFAAYAGATQYGGSGFTQASQEIAVGLDLSRDALIRPLSTQSDSGGSIVVLPDDQFVARSDKAGFYAFLEESRVVVDARAISGIII